MAYQTGNAPQFQNAFNVPAFQTHNVAQEAANIQNTQAQTGLIQAQVPNALAQAQSTMADVPLKAAQANAQNALPGLYNAQASNQTAQAGLTNTQNQMMQLQQALNLTGSVMNAPTDAQPGAYIQALKMAKQAGIDISAFPDTWGPAAQSAVQAAYQSSSQGLERLKAFGQLGLQAQQNQMQAAQMIQMMQMNGIQPSPQLMQAASGGTAAQFLGQALPGGQGGGLGQGGMQGQGTPYGQSAGASMMPTAANNINMQPGAGVMVMPGSQQGGGAQSTVPPISRIAGDTKQAQDWNDAQMTAAKTSEIARQTQAAIDSARANLTGSIIPTSPIPGVGTVRGHTTAGENLDAATSQAQAGLISMDRLQQGRVPPKLTELRQQAAPGNDVTPEANLNRVNVMDAYNKFSGFQAEIYKQLSSLGVTDKTVAQSIVNKTWDNLGAVDSKTGKLDPSKVSQAALYSALNKAVNGQDETKGATLMYTSPKVQGLISQDDLEATAQARHIPLDKVMSDFSASPSNFNPGK